MDTAFNLQVWEVLKNCQNAKSDERRVQILKENKVKGVADIVKMIYDTRLTCLLPNTPPPFQTITNGTAPSSLHRHSNSGVFRNFFKGLAPTTVNPIQREKMFIQILESVCKEEAELLVGMLNKKMPQRFYKVTEDIVRQAFPDLLHPILAPSAPATQVAPPQPPPVVPALNSAPATVKHFDIDPEMAEFAGAPVTNAVPGLNSAQ